MGAIEAGAQGRVALDWYAAEVTSGRERTVADAVEALGLVAYVPVWRRQGPVNRRTGQRKMVSSPLVPRWVFVGWPRGLPHAFDAVAAHRDVRGFVGVDGVPSRIRCHVMDGFIRAHGKDGFTLADQVETDAERLERLRAQLGKVHQARVAQGSFAGTQVTVRSVGDKHAKVVMQLFGGQRLTVVPIGALVPLDV
ncbi:transcription termination/antitermination protein NusG [Monaibacterium marinum]|nr:transcription termination/antitermination NusG family protein [Monaibacterium marinum]